ncbi:elongator complex protein isoform X1 [Carex rostrata]
MAEAVLRSLRDGCLEGEHAPALSIQDSLLSPLASHAFRHFLTSLLSLVANGKSQSRGIVLVAFDRSPSFYLDLFKSAGFDTSTFDKGTRILDCYTDPVGWKDAVRQSGKNSLITLVKNVKDVDKLLCSIVDLAKEFSGEGKERVVVAIDSVSHILRHAPLSSVLRLLSNLRCHEKISSLFWLIHTDLHEPKVVGSFEYISTMVASLEPIVQLPDYANGNSGNITSLEENYSKAKFNVRLKRRNGRIKLFCEELLIEQDSVKFSSVPSISSVVTQNLIPKVQFNLQLSDKERMDRANVVLPFEHQGDGRNIDIYDGRRSLGDGGNDPSSTKSGGLLGQNKLSNSNNNQLVRGEIHYIRDSDDEQADSDEDPDDDLDI